MFEVVVSDQFTAAHQLRRQDGSLEPLHTHDWSVQVTYAGERLNEGGVLVDFAAVRAGLSEVLAALHERELNELPAFARRAPSAENVAAHIAERMAARPAAGTGLRCVQIEEEPGCFARYWPVR